MCCRYVLLSEHVRDLLAKAGIPDEDGDSAYPIDRYNIAPASKIHGVRGGSKGTPRKRGRVSLLWDFRQLTIKVPPAGVAPLFNARAESLWEKPVFAQAARTRRCLIPASGFYEWERAGEARLPWLFLMRDGQPFFMAGVWERSMEEGIDGRCAIVTTEPNALMRPIHHRMPAIIATENINAWLDGEITAADALRPFLAPFDSRRMTARRVSTFVNNARNDSPACFAAPPPDEQTGRQGLLF